MLKNKVIVVTGGAGLIGKSFVTSIIKNDGIAVIADVDEEIGQSIKEELSKKLDTDNVDFFKTNITSKESINSCIKFIDDKYGRIDAVVNNAYPRNESYGKHFFDVDYLDFIDNISLNLGGYFLVSQQVSSYFKNQGHGNIVNIGSIYGVVPPKFEIYDNTDMTTPVEYAVIKSGLIHLTKYMAKYFKGHGIRVNTLSPGGVFNKQPESFLDKYKEECLSKGMLDSGDLGGTLVYLLSDMSQYVNGQNIIVDDGFCL